MEEQQVRRLARKLTGEGKPSSYVGMQEAWL